MTTFTFKLKTDCLCGGEFEAGYDDEARPAIIYSIPMCEKFVELGPEKLLKWVRITKTEEVK